MSDDFDITVEYHMEDTPAAVEPPAPEASEYVPEHLPTRAPPRRRRRRRRRRNGATSSLGGQRVVHQGGAQEVPPPPPTAGGGGHGEQKFETT